LQVVSRIKEKSGETTLLVVDSETDQYFKDNNIKISEKLLNDITNDSLPSPPIEADVQVKESTSTPSSNPPVVHFIFIFLFCRGSSRV